MALIQMKLSSFKLNIEEQCMPSWFFPKLCGGEEQGLNDAGIESFKRAESLARETCQNIGDVRDGSREPAIATFELINLPSNEFPGREELISIYESCRDYVLDGCPDGTGNESKFFEKALALLNSKSIPILRIGDENTKGLIGTDTERSQPFYRLLKLQGASSLQGDGGGTYGIGQRAPFAHSALRTVLYSTKTPEGNLFIAKSILASFPHPDTGEMTQSKGWWCNPSEDTESWSSIRDDDQIPERFIRDKIGSDIWVTGFQTENWEQSVRHSVLEHFFAAIENGRLVVQFLADGKVVKKIEKANLEKELICAADEARKLHSSTAYRKSLGSTLYFHKALISPLNGKPFEENISKIGNVKLYLYRDASNSDMPNRWATMRKPRIIVEHYGSGILTGFAAVLICDNRDGNKYLSELEGPTHEKWNEEETRNWSPKQKKEAKKVLAEITAFVRATLKKVRGDDLKEQEEIPFLGRYLPADDDESGENSSGAVLPTGKKVEGETGERITRDVPPRVIKGKAVVKNPSKVIDSNLDVPDIPAPELGPNPEPGPGPAPAPGPKPVPDPRPGPVITPGVKDKAFSLSDIRFRSFKTGERYKLIIQARKDIEGDLPLKAIGEDLSFPVVIRSAFDSSENALPVMNNLVKNLKLLAGDKQSMTIEVDTDIDLCLGVGS
jgi:hypothetical protein